MLTRATIDRTVAAALEEDAPWGLFSMVHMEDELVEIFGRPVDLLTRRSIERSLNPIRRDSILGNAVSLEL